MQNDTILSEVWRNRDAYAREHGNDLGRMVADLRQRQQAHPQRVVLATSAPRKVAEMAAGYGGERDHRHQTEDCRPETASKAGRD